MWAESGWHSFPKAPAQIGRSFLIPVQGGARGCYHGREFMLLSRCLSLTSLNFMLLCQLVRVFQE